MCDCITSINALLAPKGVEVQTAFLVTKEGQLALRIMLSVVKLEGAPRRTKVPIVAASYCPFCGEKVQMTEDL